MQLNYSHFIDLQTFKSLNLKSVLDLISPYSELGRKVKLNFKPFTPGKEQELRKEYQRLEKLGVSLRSNESFFLSLTSFLSKFEDINPLIGQLNEGKHSQKNENSNHILELDELHNIKRFIFYFEEVRKMLLKYNLNELIPLPSLNELFIKLDPEEVKTPVFSIGKSFSPTLANLKAQKLQKYYQYKKLEGDRIKNAKQELALPSIEHELIVSRNNHNLLNKLDHTNLFRIINENFANITYCLTQSKEMIELEKQMKDLRIQIDKEEKLIRHQITKDISRQKDILSAALKAIGELDYLTARTVFGNEHDCIAPRVATHKDEYETSVQSKEERKIPIECKTQLYAIGAVNLNVKKSLEINDIYYQPIDINFNEKINIITGANMAGKSTLLETAGQLVYLTCMAIPLPCNEAVTSLVDFIFCSRLSESKSRKDLSSFAAEIVSLNEAISKKKGRGLFLIDEFARGTNPSEGEAFALAVLDYISQSEKRIDCDDLVISTTHFLSRNIKFKAAHYRIIGISPEDYRKLHNSLENVSSNNENDLYKRIAGLHKYMNYQPEEINYSDSPPQAAIMIADILGINNDIMEIAKNYLDHITEEKSD